MPFSRQVHCCRPIAWGILCAGILSGCTAKSNPETANQKTSDQSATQAAESAADLKDPPKSTRNEPELQVRIDWPGASPEDVEARLAQPLEEALAKLPGVIDLETECSEGVMLLAIRFDSPTAITKAQSNLSERLQELQAGFPEGAGVPRIHRQPFESLPQAWILVASGQRSRGELTRIAEQLRDNLSQQRPISEAAIHGSAPQVLSVKLDFPRLLALGLTPQQILDHCETFINQHFLAGPSRTLEDFSRSVVTQREGVPIRLNDVAEVRPAYDSQTQGAVFWNDNSAVAMGVTFPPDVDPKTADETLK